jgi:hypothetical protein
MKTSRLFTTLAGLAIVAFPVTLAIVAFEPSTPSLARLSLFDWFGKQKKPTGEQLSHSELSADSSSDQSKTALDGTGGNSAKTSIGALGASSDGAQPNKNPTHAVVRALRTRVKELGEAIEQAKAEEVYLKAALTEKQSFQKVTARTIKATERAIREIEGATSKPATLREPKPSQDLSRSSDQSDLPTGWQGYFGKLGKGFGREYTLAELDKPTALVRLLLALPATEPVPSEVTRGEAKATFKRIVYLSGVDASDPRLEELRRIGEQERLEFKRVRSDVPLFEDPYMMVQVIPQMLSMAQPSSEQTSPQEE